MGGRSLALALGSLFVCALAACGDGAPPDGPAPPRRALGPAPTPPPAPNAAPTATAPDRAGRVAANAPESVDDPVFDARLLAMIAAVLGPEYDASTWAKRLDAREPWNGVLVWIPGTGGYVADEGARRAMGAVPSGFAARGSAVAWTDPASAGTTHWIGYPSAQARAGALWPKSSTLSALQVFDTAWSDAQAIVLALGSRLRGAWIVGHSAGALPALLAGLAGGAHRIDGYGVPSAVGPLDGARGAVHLHTDPLDPAGSMGRIDDEGRARIDLLSAGVTFIHAGLDFEHHDYKDWPAPAP
jgi:hypothetical protein